MPYNLALTILAEVHVKLTCGSNPECEEINCGATEYDEGSEVNSDATVVDDREENEE